MAYGNSVDWLVTHVIHQVERKLRAKIATVLAAGLGVSEEAVHRLSDRLLGEALAYVRAGCISAPGVDLTQAAAMLEVVEAQANERIHLRVGAIIGSLIDDLRIGAL